MKIKSQLYVIQLIFSSIIILFLFFTYKNYETYYLNSVNEDINKSIIFYKNEILTSLKTMILGFEEKKELFKATHKRAENILKIDSNEDLKRLQNQLSNEFNLKNINIDISLINKNYEIVNSTFKNDYSFDFSLMLKSKKFLKEIQVDNNIYLFNNIFEDSIDGNYKFYTFSKISNNIFLKISFKDNILHKEIYDSLYTKLNKTNKLVLYNIVKKDDYQYYYSLTKENNAKSEKEYVNGLNKFSINEKNSNNILTVNSHKENIIIQNNNSVIIYSPIFSKKELVTLGLSDVVMYLELDINNSVKTFDSFKTIFILSTSLIIIFLFLLFIWIRKKITIPTDVIVKCINNSEKINSRDIICDTDEFGIIKREYNNLFDSLNLQIDKNSKLLSENKDFIADMVHQIRTPLSVIMTNLSLIEMKSSEDVNSHINHINYSISMLSNSYEDLSYIISHDTIDYNPTEINLSNFLHERIDFFNNIIVANKKIIEYKIEADIKIDINDIEIERLIDNNISNAIKYGLKYSVIQIFLKKIKNEIILDFISEGKAIENPTLVFDKNFKENNHRKSFGLGLNMVKLICDKNNVIYELKSKNNKNIFRYIFKK